MAQESYARKPGDEFDILDGQSVSITNLSGAFRSCLCGHTAAKVSTDPVGAHHGRLICKRCERTTSYLSIDHLQAMLAAHGGEKAA